MERERNEGAGPETTGNQEQERSEQMRSQRPRIYVASLSDYNAGRLHGAWIDATAEPEELHDQVRAMLERSGEPVAEEFAIHDYEHFGHYRVGEYDSLETISEVARGINEHGMAFSAWAELCRGEDDELERFEEAFMGEWGSLSDYVDDFLDDLGAVRELEEHVPDFLAPYVRVDVDAFAHDLEMSGDVHVAEHAHGVWVFDVNR